jgi:hypothetical protein
MEDFKLDRIYEVSKGYFIDLEKVFAVDAATSTELTYIHCNFNDMLSFCNIDRNKLVETWKDYHTNKNIHL